MGFVFRLLMFVSCEEFFFAQAETGSEHFNGFYDSFESSIKKSLAEIWWWKNW